MHAAMFLRYAWPSTYRNPSAISRRIPGPGRPSAWWPSGAGFRPPDQEDEERRSQERDGVERHRDRRPQDPDQDAGQPRPDHLGGRPADLELRVALLELVAGDDGREVALVGDVEEDGQDADGEADDVELDDGQDAEQERERDGRQGEGSPQVAGDHHRAASQPVDPHACREPDQEERQEVDDVEEGDLEGGRLQDVDGDEGDRQRADLRPELADRLGRPQPHEVGVAQEARRWRGRWPGHRRPR